jgi:hypothetical protein
MVPVKSCLSPSEALVVSSYLADNGIFAALNGYHHGATAWHCLYALNGIQISVLDVDFDRASELLVETPFPRGADAGGDVEGPVRARATEIGLAAAALLLTGLPMPVWLRRPRQGR